MEFAILFLTLALSSSSNSHRYDLLKLCNEGPEDKLNKTVYCQPAILVTSLASLELLKKHQRNAIESCIGTAGFSLGEITSLVFSGALPFDRGTHTFLVISHRRKATWVEVTLENNNFSDRIGAYTSRTNANGER